jgi:hypothetical protein
MFYQQVRTDHVRDLESALTRARTAEAAWKDELERHLRIEQFHDSLMEESKSLRVVIMNHKQKKYGDGIVIYPEDSELYNAAMEIMSIPKPEE